jgi:Ca2+-binding EF-hand superfamily protein
MKTYAWRWILLGAILTATGALAEKPAGRPKGPGSEARESNKGRRPGPDGRHFLPRFDENKDGKLCPAEREKARNAMDRERERMKKKFDADGDGKLNEEERAKLNALRKERREQAERMRNRMLKKFDADGDGKLNEEERAKAREFAKERHENMLKKYDRDGDGKLSPDEREAMKKDRPPVEEAQE